MSKTIFRRGSIMTPEGPFVADVAVVGGTITAISENLTAGDESQVYDCHGMWVGPGFVDIHTHLREPGQEHKEDIDSGSRTAAAGGYTAIVAMPNTDPATDSAQVVNHVAQLGQQVGLVEVSVAGCVTLGRRGERLAPLDELWTAGVRMFTDDGDVVADAGVLRQAMEAVVQLDGVISQHAIDPSLGRDGHMHEGSVAAGLQMAGIPSVAETIVVARDIELVRFTGCRYHVQHISAAGTLAILAEAKANGLPVTAEVTPHHLAFTEADVESCDPNFKMMPPLRTEADRVALVEGLRSGIIDVVATDHAPHAQHEKDVTFEQAPNGVIGIEWAAAVVNDIVGLDPAKFFEVMSVKPAEIARIPGQGQWLAEGRMANIVVFDPRGTTTVDRSLSKSSNAPYLGRSYAGAVQHTMYAGSMTYSKTGTRT